MALKKVTSKVIYGSTLLQHYGQDISDSTSSSSSYTRWGEVINFTPIEDNSHLEIVVTGSVFTSSDMDTSNRYGNMSIRVNNVDEYIQEGILGGRTTQAGTRHWHTPRHQQHNGRQQYHYSNFGTAIYANHIFQPKTTNNQAVEIMFSSDNSRYNLQCKDGFVTVSEISNHHYNKT